MTTADTAIELTALQWNVMVGGIDGDNEGRRVSQVAFLESHPQLDLLWIMEGTGWHEGCRIHEVEDATDLTALPRVTSRIGDQVNHSIMFYNAEKLTPLGKPGELARGPSTTAPFEPHSMSMALPCSPSARTWRTPTRRPGWPNPITWPTTEDRSPAGPRTRSYSWTPTPRTTTTRS